jgi:hypothetical protein
MAKFMTPRMARVQIIADENAPVRLRIQALKEVHNPPIAMLRRLVAVTAARKLKPVPSRLRALALMRYAQEVERRKIKVGHPVKKATVNPLGIE